MSRSLTVVQSSPDHGLKSRPLGFRKPPPWRRPLAVEIDLPDQRASFLCLHALVGDIGVRSDRDAELQYLLIDREVAHPVPAGGGQIGVAVPPDAVAAPSS